MRKELLAFIILSLFVAFSPFFIYFLSSTVARIAIILLFLLPVLWVVSFTLRTGYDSEARIAGAVTCFVIPTFMFILTNLNNFPTFFQGMELTETRLAVQNYLTTGHMNFLIQTHAPFFQTYYLVYAVSVICGLPVYVAILIGIVFYIVFTGCISVYALKLLADKTPRKVGFLPYLIVFSLIGGSIMMATNLPYRYIGEFLFGLLVFALLSLSLKSHGSHVLFLLLVIGVTIGDPVSAILSVPLFFFYSIIKKDYSIGVFSAIPISYVIYNGGAYLSLLRTYSSFAWSGFQSFFQRLAGGQFTQTTLPWQRTISITPFDSYVSSAGFLSLLLLSSIVVVFFLWQSFGSRREINKGRGSLLVQASTVLMVFVLLLVIATYIGASVQGQVTFSDIRTIVLGYISLILLFGFISATFMSKLASKKLFTLIIVILLLVCSLRIVFEVYPKSSSDPINTVEDFRIDTRQIQYANRFLLSYFNGGEMLRDHKTIFYGFPYVAGSTSLLDQIGTTSLRTISYVTWVVIDVNELNTTSEYASVSTYQQVYQYGLANNLIYNNGGTLIFVRTR